MPVGDRGTLEVAGKPGRLQTGVSFLRLSTQWGMRTDSLGDQKQLRLWLSLCHW